MTAATAWSEPRPPRRVAYPNGRRASSVAQDFMEYHGMHKLPAVALLTMATTLATIARAEEVGSFTNDWIGNGIVIDAIADPKVDGVTCHMSSFDRSLIDRLSKGNWFEDPSNAAISCAQTGPITIRDIEKGKGGEEVFSQRISLVFKSLGVRRIYDERNASLVYVVYSRQITQGSAKMGLSTVALYGQQVTWAP
jgi:CreA protein